MYTASQIRSERERESGDTCNTSQTIVDTPTNGKHAGGKVGGGRMGGGHAERAVGGVGEPCRQTVRDVDRTGRGGGEVCRGEWGGGPVQTDCQIRGQNGRWGWRGEVCGAGGGGAVGRGTRADRLSDTWTERPF